VAFVLGGAASWWWTDRAVRAEFAGLEAELERQVTSRDSVDAALNRGLARSRAREDTLRQRARRLAAEMETLEGRVADSDAARNTAARDLREYLAGDAMGLNLLEALERGFDARLGLEVQRREVAEASARASALLTGELEGRLAAAMRAIDAKDAQLRRAEMLTRRSLAETGVADTAVRLMSPGRELKLGVLTALVGAPFFLFLVLRLRRRLP
jgi:uncharacterized coiled-coil protein SlyX